MAKSTITLTFNSLPSVDNILELSNSEITGNILEVFKTLRTVGNQSTIGLDIESCILEYESAISCIRFNIIWFYYCLTIQAPMERCSRTF